MYFCIPISGLAKLVFLTYDNLNDLLKPQRDRSFENEIDEFKAAREETKYKVSDNGHAVEGDDNVEDFDVTTGQDNGTFQVEQ